MERGLPGIHVRARLGCAGVFVVLAFAGLAGAAEPPVRQVLVLQSFDRGNRILDHFTTNLRVELDEQVGGPVNYIQVIVGPTGFVGAPERSVVEFIRSNFVDRPKPDLIISIAGPAAVFARKYREQLFPDTPLLFASIDRRYLGEAPLGANESAVPVVNDFPMVLDDVLQLRPQTRQVFMIIGSGSLVKFWRPRLEEQFRRFDHRLKFIWSDEMSLPEILRRCSTLPENSAIYYVAFGTDAAGAAYADDRVFAELHATANAPMFALHDVYLGAGIVGGRLMQIDELVRRTSRAAGEILNGASPANVAVPPLLPGPPVFDARELRRWDIPESRLPPGSIVEFRSPTLWTAYRGAVLAGTGALAIQALLIIALLFERRARRRAEIESRRTLGLASDVNRRETMSALTSSIAHELAQPLSAMIHNAEALQLMIDSQHAIPGDIRDVLSDIENDGILASEIIERHRTMLRSRQMQTRSIHLKTIVDDTLALVAHEMIARHVEVDTRLAGNSCLINADPVLLEQVFVNLVINAMDAMDAKSTTSSTRRHITIASEVRGGTVQVSVHDSGPGFAADIAGRLFTPFVTTKPHGLGIGLAIARTIVEAHQGSINARNHPDGGAEFTVTLPIKRERAAELESAAALN
jgi:signal transduction histidine kinase